MTETIAPFYADPGVNLFLTSGGITTQRLRTRAYEFLGRQHAPLKAPRIGMIIDGQSSRSQRFARKWTSHWLTFAFGDTTQPLPIDISCTSFLGLNRILSSVDALLVPGGNTHDTVRYVQPADLKLDCLRYSELTEKLAGGLPCFTESAGSISVGRTLGPAAIAPADPLPKWVNPNRPPQALGIINADVIVHAPRPSGERTRLPGAVGLFGELGLRFGTTSSQANIDAYCRLQTESGSPVTYPSPIILSDVSAAIVADSRYTMV